MTEREGRLALNGALSQLDRLRAAPAPDRVQVDGRTVASLLSFAAEYGSLIQFYDIADRPDGDWAQFYTSDASIALALVAALDLANIEAQLERLLQSLRAIKSVEERLELLDRAIRVILRLSRVLVRGEPAPDTLERALHALAASDRRDILAEPARRLLSHLRGEPLESGLRRDVECLVGGWFHLLIDFLDDLVAVVIDALTQARKQATTEMDASLLKHSHAPQSGLWDAFALLFGHAQASINRFPNEFLKFYQTQVLQQDSRVGHPDQVLLDFTLAKGASQLDLAKGTEFSAGTDGKGESIAYALDSALTVDATAVNALRTVTINSQPLLPGAGLTAVQVLTGIVTLAATAPAIATPFPLFGTTTAGTEGVLTTSLATLGFAVASPTLLLQGGSRVVKLELIFTPDSLAAAQPLLGAMSQAVGCSDPMQLLAQLLQRSFSLRYSSVGGWVDVPGYTVAAPTPEDSRFILSFTLDTDADALETFAGGTGVETTTPMIVASLVQNQIAVGEDSDGVEVWPYSVLSLLVLASLEVSVDVKELSELTLTSPAGPMDTSQPFALFGAVPVQHAAVDVSAPELFVKQLDTFSMSIDWFGLPVTSAGFAGYYNAYIVDADGNTVAPGSLFNNASFTTSAEVVNPGLWTIKSSREYLFQTTTGVPTPAPDVPVLAQTTLVETVDENTPGLYYDPTISSVRLSLEEPSYAFGNVLYAANVMAASVQLTTDAAVCAQRCAKPLLLDATEVRAGKSVEEIVSELDADALSAIESAIAACGKSAARIRKLTTTLATAVGRRESLPLWRRLLTFRRRRPDVAAIHANLQEWLSDHAAELREKAAGFVGKAEALLASGSRALAGSVRAVAKPIAIGQTITPAECVQRCLAESTSPGFPNQPWVPMAASLTVDYTATATVPFPQAVAPSTADVTYFQLAPFNEVRAVDWPPGATVPLLVPVPEPGLLYIGLSSPATTTLSLLFRLSPPATGWPAHTPQLTWEQAVDGGVWSVLIPQSDTTNGFKNSGIVRIDLAPAPEGTPLCVRVGAASDPTIFPALAALATNAASATWVGPGGAPGLGVPLAPGTITKPLAALPGIGVIDQPMPSVGGRSEATGKTFDLWLAERLRHKDRGIQSWDYAALLLAAFPSLWQVAVVPASEGAIGEAPGHVWIVPVPGPTTPDIEDPTIPSVDSQLIGQISDYLQDRISPFVEPTVTNPPYVRLTVTAELLFTGDDADQACITRLNEELIEYLSPWPPKSFGRRRPSDYYTTQEVSHFVRHRPYVRGILSLKLTPEANESAAGRHYFTSALSHNLSAGNPERQRD